MWHVSSGMWHASSGMSATQCHKQYLRIPYLLIQVIVVDEIGNAKEVAAIKDIASRGVAMVATVHGTSLERLLENPVLSPLVGGKQRMVIGDLAAAQ